MNIHSIDTVYRFKCGRCGYIREFGSMISAEAFMYEHNRMHDTTTSGWSTRGNVECPRCKGTNCKAAPFRDLPYGVICRNPEHKCPDCVDGRIRTPENVETPT